jgi:hypothetical protein
MSVKRIKGCKAQNVIGHISRKGKLDNSITTDKIKGRRHRGRQ